MEATSRPGPDTSGTHGFDGFIEKVGLTQTWSIPMRRNVYITTDTLGSLVSLGVLTWESSLCVSFHFGHFAVAMETSYEQPTARQRGVRFSHAAPRLGDQQ